MFGELIGPPCTACVSESRFVHVTVSPTWTVRSAGWNAKPWIVTADVAAELLVAAQRPRPISRAMAKPSQRVNGTVRVDGWGSGGNGAPSIWDGDRYAGGAFATSRAGSASTRLISPSSTAIQVVMGPASARCWRLVVANARRRRTV